jgi:hypothetical protein
LVFDDYSNPLRNAEVPDPSSFFDLYNTDTAGSLYQSADGWVFDAIYEFQIDGSVFGNQLVIDNTGYLNGFGMTFETLHASPHKEGEFDSIIPLPPLPSDPEVPEPATMALMGLGLAGIAARFRKSRSASRH